jgi:hypothetical protein
MLNKDYTDMLHTLSDEKVRSKNLANAEALESLKNSEQITPADKK